MSSSPSAALCRDRESLGNARIWRHKLVAQVGRSRKRQHTKPQAHNMPATPCAVHQRTWNTQWATDVGVDARRRPRGKGVHRHRVSGRPSWPEAELNSASNASECRTT